MNRSEAASLGAPHCRAALIRRAAQSLGLFRPGTAGPRLLQTRGRQTRSGRLQPLKVKTMSRKIQGLFLAISALAMPAAGAFAENTTPATTNFQGATAAPTPGNKAPASAAAETSRTTAPGAMGTRGGPGANDRMIGGQPGMRSGGTSTGGSGRGSERQ